MTPTIDTYVALAAARKDSGDLVGAEQALTMALLIKPNAKAYRLRGAIRQALGDLAGSAYDHGRATRIDASR